MNVQVRRSMYVLLLFITVLVTPTVALGAEDDKIGVGGSINFTEESTVPVPEGLGRIEPEFEMRVQNTGSKRGTFQFTAETPESITLQADADKFELDPQEIKTVTWGYEVREGTAPGVYNTFMQAKQVDLPPTEDGGVQFAPAFGAHLNIEVTGATAKVVGKVSSEEGVPVSGTLTLNYIPKDTEDRVLPVASAEGTEIEATVSPGNYRLNFEMPGLIAAEEEFSVSAGETKEVHLVVNAVNFIIAAAKPDQPLKELQTATLLGSVKNHLAEIKGPIEITADVIFDGEPLETTSVDKYPNLPNGLTEFKETYRPVLGWEPGTYEFKFKLIAPDFTVAAPQTSIIEVPNPLVALLKLLIPLIIIFIIIVWIWLLFACGRRKRREDEEGEENLRPRPWYLRRCLRRKDEKEAKASAPRVSSPAAPPTVRQVPPGPQPPQRPAPPPPQRRPPPPPPT